MSDPVSQQRSPAPCATTEPFHSSAAYTYNVSTAAAECRWYDQCRSCSVSYGCRNSRHIVDNAINQQVRVTYPVYRLYLVSEDKGAVHVDYYMIYQPWSGSDRVAAPLWRGHVYHVDYFETEGKVQVKTNFHNVDSFCSSKGQMVL